MGTRKPKMPDPNPEVVDFKVAHTSRLATARRTLKSLGAELEHTLTLSKDMIEIRRLRLIIDDCKRKLENA